MILFCPHCNGQHLDFDDSDPQIRRCLECGIYWIVEDDLWQVEPLAQDPRWREFAAQADG